jgi:hypothetical protein
MPAPSSKAQIVLLLVRETQALSSVGIGDEDSTVYAAKVVVEPGPEPVYLVMASDEPVIWQFSGDTRRIERVVLSSQSLPPHGNVYPAPPLVGATGVPDSKVSFFARTGCIKHSGYHAENLRTADLVRQQLGRDTKVATASYNLTSVSVPSGKIERIPSPVEAGKPLAELRSPHWKSYASWPAGVIQFDPKTVVASRPAVAFKVMPREAGLAQLVDAGAIRQAENGEFIVLKKFSLPPELGLNHVIVVPMGAPVPDGGERSPCVIVEGRETRDPKPACGYTR